MIYASFARALLIAQKYFILTIKNLQQISILLCTFKPIFSILIFIGLLAICIIYNYLPMTHKQLSMATIEWW